MDKRLWLLSIETIQVVNKLMWKVINIITHEENSNTSKNHNKIHYIPTRMAKIKNTNNNNAGEDIEQVELLYIWAGNKLALSL